MNEPVKVAVLELRRLLIELKEHRPDICIRYRLIGQMWAQNFLRVVNITSNGVLLNDETLNKLITISDLSQIMQFELDKPFQAFQPYFHYTVLPSREWS
jgi:hypothetical protein